MIAGNNHTPKDSTIEAGTRGIQVVDATLAKLLQHNTFTSDQGLLRRIACVESTYGTDADTYRDGYHGGIWQVCILLIIYRDVITVSIVEFRKIAHLLGV